MHRVNHWRPAALVAVLVGALATGCSSSGSPLPSVSLPSPLPTTVSPGLLTCGFFPIATVRTVLGRQHFDAHPSGSGRHRTCAITVPGGGRADALDIAVHRVAATDVDIVRTAKSEAAAFSYPSDIGVGFASHDLYHDAAGREYHSAETGLIRGDWTITAGIQLPAAGRDPLADVVAIVQQVIAALNIPAHPSRPYPAPVASALHG